MSDDELYKLYRWLVDKQGIDPELKEMRDFRHAIDHSSNEILERVRNIGNVRSLGKLYG